MKRHDPGKILHRAVECSGMLHFAGIVADEPGASMTRQTQQIIDKFAGLLASYGSGMSRVVSATIYITDMKLKDEMNAVWTERFAPAALPARATIGVNDLGPGYLIEIVFLAASGTED